MKNQFHSKYRFVRFCVESAYSSIKRDFACFRDFRSPRCFRQCLGHYVLIVLAFKVRRRIRDNLFYSPCYHLTHRLPVTLPAPESSNWYSVFSSVYAPLEMVVSESLLEQKIPSFYRYLCLIQIHSNDHQILIDQLNVRCNDHTYNQH